MIYMAQTSTKIATDINKHAVLHHILQLSKIYFTALKINQCFCCCSSFIILGINQCKQHEIKKKHLLKVAVRGINALTAISYNSLSSELTQPSYLKFQWLLHNTQISKQESML